MLGLAFSEQQALDLTMYERVLTSAHRSVSCYVSRVFCRVVAQDLYPKSTFRTGGDSLQGSLILLKPRILRKVKRKMSSGPGIPGWASRGL